MFQLVIASSVNALMAREVAGYELASGELWRHAVAVSVASENLARELEATIPEETFTAALLHDIGKLVLGDYVDCELAGIEGVASTGRSFETAEREVLGADHAQVGAEVLREWSLPTEIVEAVRWHHEPDSCQPANVVSDVVHVADVLCLMLGIGTGREGLGYRPSPGATQRLGLRVSDLEAVASRVLDGVDELLEGLDCNSGK